MTTQHPFMVKLQGAVYSNELYKVPSLAGNHIYNLQEAIKRAKALFPHCEFEVYNGSESWQTENYNK